ncbi:hypothetical protein [Lihuaxuella thermophila]|uniref:WYL domain-containing protein n=1 Tax=Lihuaxuella thermophila TaxID=1173111 RepID=A0A1H8JEM4_9BACL|nr:hypothetical protein [Lihuaxuella thermophila]SEN79254.1 hypothetical protein SAMN05444955_12428 [Lihuaxuella thermophila]
MVDLILKKAFEAGRNVQIIYVDQNDEITQRWIKIFQLGEAKIGAYCYLRKGPRLFDRSNILGAG